MKTVIIGGVAGGASAAARLRRLDESAEIIILERGAYISFANCGLPYYIGGEITDRSALTLQTPESFHARFNVDVRIHNEATAIDTENKQVTVYDHQLGKEYVESYDNLILSPGAAPILPPLPGVDLEGVFTLRNIPDTYRIHSYVHERDVRRAVVVGGGYIGVEMAENLQNAGVQVTIVEMQDHLIASLDADTACDVHNYLAEKGLDLRLSTSVQSIERTEAGLRVQTTGGAVDCEMVLMSVGVRPESGLAKDAGIELGLRGCVKVDAHMRTSAPDVYAVGDVIEITDFITGKPGFVPLAGPANRQGRIAADNICGIPSTYKHTQGSAVLKVFDMTVACTGITESTAKAEGYHYDKVFLYAAAHAGYYPGGHNMAVKLIFDTDSGRVLGGQFVGFEGVDKRCDVLAVAIRAGMTVNELCDLELCYAPPFSAAKDPVNMAGFAAQNILTGKVRNFHWEALDTLDRAKVTLLDVRRPDEYEAGHIDGFVHIPLDELRAHLDTLDRSKPVYVHCFSGLRSYVACRILSGHGFTCYNISGGYHLYDSLRRSAEIVRGHAVQRG